MHGRRGRGRVGRVLVIVVDDSFNFGRPAARYRGKHARTLDRRALSHGALAFAVVIFAYALVRVI